MRAHGGGVRRGRVDSPAVRFVHALAVAPAGRRRRWTLAGLTLFATSLAAVILAGLATDALLSLPALPGAAAWRVAGVGLLLGGLGLCAWCVGLFARARGTPVPARPPAELIQRGPYAWVRNPMLTGVFAALFGTGVLLRSPSLVLLWAPLYVLLHVLELKWVEEPELERRFGVAYRAYSDAVPMFFPLPRIVPGPQARAGGGTEAGDRALRLLSVVFVGLIAGGLLFVAAPDWVGLAWLNQGVDRAFFGGAVPSPGARAMRRWLYGVEGATLVAFGVLGLAVIRTAGSRLEPWSWKALAAAVGVWFLLDTSVSVAYGVWPNAALNALIALVVLVPVLALRRAAGGAASRDAGDADVAPPPAGKRSP